MGKGITVSPKHGVNPSIAVCFWCGKEKNDIVLLGKLKNDAEAPRKAVFNYDPCDDCKKRFAQGVLIMEGTSEPQHEGQKPLGGAYPTGAFAVVRPEAFSNGMKAGTKAYMNPADFKRMMDGAREGKDDEQDE